MKPIITLILKCNVTENYQVVKPVQKAQENKFIHQQQPGKKILILKGQPNTEKYTTKGKQIKMQLP